MMRDRISEGEVAAVLRLIAEQPNARSQPSAGDLVGDYDSWFDGGALRSETGATRFQFANGLQARVGVMPVLVLTINFPDGRSVTIRQDG